MDIVTSKLWIDGRIWGSSCLKDNLLALADDFGPRFCGTPQEAQARGWIVARMREYGLEKVRTEELQYLAWSWESASLQIYIGANPPRSLWVIPHVYCPPAEVSKAEVVYVGTGTEREFEEQKERIRGRFVLCETVMWSIFRRGYASQSQAVKQAIESGAVGFILMAAAPAAGPRVGSAPHQPGQACAIPVVGIPLEDGEFIKRALRRGDDVTLTLHVSSRVKQATTFNIIGEIEAGKANKGHILLTAHYDGLHVGQGAGDNASGVAVILETARILAELKDQLHSSIHVVCFAAEEVGLLGSKAYLERHADELSRLLFIFNVDIARRPFGLMIQCSPALFRAVEVLWDKLDRQLHITDVRNDSSDDAVFVRKGIPAIAYMGEVDALDTSYSHSPADTLDKVDLQDLRAATSVVCTTVFHLAQQADPPCARLTPSELEEYLSQDTDRHFPFGK
jgi:Iap family predicted aminopeptidase